MDASPQEGFSEEQRQEVILMEIRNLHVKHQVELADRFNQGLMLGAVLGAVALALGLMLG